MKSKMVTLRNCWTKIDFTVTNQFALDSYLLERMNTDGLLKVFIQESSVDILEVLAEFNKRFDTWYKGVMLFFKNFPELHDFNPIEHKLIDSTFGDYIYLAEMYIMFWLRSNAASILKAYPDLGDFGVEFDDKLQESIVYDLIFRGSDSLIGALQSSRGKRNVFAVDYEITKIDYPNIEIDKAACLAMLMTMVSKEFIYMLGEAFDTFENDVESYKKKLGKQIEKNKKLKADYHELQIKKDKARYDKDLRIQSITREVQEKDKQIDELTGQVYVLEQQVALLQDKNMIYEFEMPSEGDRAVAEELYEEAVSEVDLTDYKIVIVTAEKDKSKYGLPIIDLTNSSDRINSLLSCDIVAFDTKHNSHHCYYNVKTFCKSNGIKFAHMTCSPASMEREIKKYILSRSIT